MFTLPKEDQNLEVKETVTFYMPGSMKAELYVTYKYFDIPSFKQLLEDTGKSEQEKKRLKALAHLKSKETSDEEAMLMLIDDQFENDTEDCDLEILKESVVNIEGIKDENGKDMPYTESVLERICNYKQPRIALIERFNRIHSDEGRKRAKRGN